MIWALIIFIILLICLIIYLIGIYLFYFALFNRRCKDYQPVYAEIKKHHHDFLAKKYSYINDKNVEIVGNFYYYEKFNNQFRGLIVNTPGMYNCKETQLSRLEIFARNGYLIYSFDGTGVGESGGKNIVGLGQSVIDLRNTLRNLATLSIIKDLDWCLYGHSWGGYAVSSVCNYNFGHKINVIIEKAGFDNIRDEFYFQGYQVLKSLVHVFLPIIVFIENKRIPENKNINSTDGILKSNAHVLIMHSKDDKMVGYDLVINKFKKYFSNNKKIHFKLFSNHGHIIDQKVDTLKRYYQLNHAGELDGYNKRYATLLYKDMDHELVHEELNFINEYIKSKDN